MARPLPTALKVVRGTNRPSRTNKSEAQPPIDAPDCPDCLDADAKREWGRLVPLLLDQGLLTRIDLAALAGYCALFARWQKAEQMISENGETVVTPNGSLQVSPWLSIAARSLAELRKFAAEFGLSPASRSKVVATRKPNNSDGWDRWD